jgi:hypothetical protein
MLALRAFVDSSAPGPAEELLAVQVAVLEQAAQSFVGVREHTVMGPKQATYPLVPGSNPAVSETAVCSFTLTKSKEMH